MRPVELSEQALRLSWRILTDERGATAIEYALIASLLSIVVIGAVLALGDTQSGMFTHVRDEVVTAIDNALGNGDPE